MARRTDPTCTRPVLESLEDRLVMTGQTASALEAVVDLKGGPTLGAIYREFEAYQNAGGTGTFSPTEAGRVYFQGTSVGVDIRFGSGDFNTLVGQLKGIGMQVTATAPATRIVEGYLPISQLPIVAANSHESSLAPTFKPILNTGGGSTSTRAQALVSEKGGTALSTIYQEYVNYQQAGGSGAFTSSLNSTVFLEGTSVGVDIRMTGDITTLVNQLKSIGMRVTATARPGQVILIEGYLPISQLPIVAANSHIVGMAANFKPILA